jgi:hypothetical protein
MFGRTVSKAVWVTGRGLQVGASLTIYSTPSAPAFERWRASPCLRTLPACLPTYLPTLHAAFVPLCLCACLPTYLPTYLPTTYLHISDLSIRCPPVNAVYM